LEFKNLDYKFEDNRNNISVGEKQLLCIARALIKKPKIILMDEATVNIDYRTESIIKKNIREDMMESTVIAIAHRIKTIIDYDNILVLKDGEIEEFDTPKNLIEKKGLFYQLFKESIV
jgi:ABC-type multidrug transport system fused ATPase/permease subunit